MTGPYTHDKIENWVSDFCLSDGLRTFSPDLRDLAASILLAFLTAACQARGIEPEEIEEADIRSALLGPVARLALPETVRTEVPRLCGEFLGYLQAQGRLSGGRLLGAFANALTATYAQESSGKAQPIVRPGSKIGRNDPCPCGSGKKYKKCCAGE